jgi:hypothetical protein
MPQTFTKLQLVTISVPGEDIYWCPIHEDSTVPGERLVYAKAAMMGQFLISPVPSSEHIPLPKGSK